MKKINAKIASTNINELQLNQKLSLLPIDAPTCPQSITISGINFSEVNILDKLQINKILLEIIKITNNQEIYCRVLQNGSLRGGDIIEYLPRSLRIQVITVSDRAFKGIYADKSGPRAVGILTTFLQQDHWRTAIDTTIIPDEPKQLKSFLEQAINNKIDIIFTLGGTGIGSRDNTTEVVASVCEKLIPGVMEYIRCKYGATIPEALLSRSIAGVANKTLLYALPGSVKAVTEYLQEILKTIKHSFYMLNSIEH